MKWITLKRYCDITGETRNAIHKRRQRGIWLDGIHCQVRGRRLWINMEEAQKWVEKGMAEAPKVKKSAA